MGQYVVPEDSHQLLFEQCEAIIEEGLKTLEKVERAFAIIEQMRLYKARFENIDSYYKERWSENIDLAHLCHIQRQKNKLN